MSDPIFYGVYREGWQRRYAQKGATSFKRLIRSIKWWITKIKCRIQGIDFIEIPPRVRSLMNPGEWHCVEYNNLKEWYLDGRMIE